jgi:hypothetical protein
MGYNMQFDWLMRVHYNALTHCDLWHCLGFSVPPPPPSSLFFSQKYKQDNRGFKIQNLSDSKKESTEGIQQIYL